MKTRRWAVVTGMAVTAVTGLMWKAGSASGDEWKPISPEELKMTDVPEAPGAPAVILYREVNRDDGRTPHEDNYVRIKILTEEGRKWANVEIQFLKENSNVHSVKGRTVHADGTVIPFDGKVYEQTIVKAKGVKYLAKTFSLPDVQVGSVIEYRYTEDFPEYYVYDSRWVLSEELFTRKAKFTLKPSTDFSLRWNWPQGLPQGTAPPKEDGRQIHMESENIPAFQVEDYMPPELSLKYRVDFIYSDELALEKDPVKYWKAVGKKQNDSVESFVNKKKAMEQAVAQIVAPNDPPEVKLQKIYARVQQLRNTSLEREKTEQEQQRDKEKAATSVEDVIRKGYGNGRQLTWLFLGLARAAGFDASPVLVSRRSDYFFNTGVMNDRELNDNVVLVKVNGKDEYFDPGTAFTSYGMLPWWNTSVAGLRLGKDGGGWVRTTLPDSMESRVERKADLKLNTEGTLQGKLTVTFIGCEAQGLRMEEHLDDETGRKKLLEDRVKQMVPAAIEVELQNKPDWSSSASSLVAEYSLKVPGWVSGAGKMALFPVGLFSAQEKGVFASTSRVHPVYFSYPFRNIDDITVHLPAGWKLSSLAKPVDQDGKAVAYALTADGKEGTLHLTRMVRSDLVLVPRENYPALRAFFEFVRTGDEEQVALQPGSAAASN